MSTHKQYMIGTILTMDEDYVDFNYTLPSKIQLSTIIFSSLDHLAMKRGKWRCPVYDDFYWERHHFQHIPLPCSMGLIFTFWPLPFTNAEDAGMVALSGDPRSLELTIKLTQIYWAEDWEVSQNGSYLQFSSIFNGIFHDINHLATGVGPLPMAMGQPSRPMGPHLLGDTKGASA